MNDGEGQGEKTNRGKGSSFGIGFEASDDDLLGKQGVFDFQIITIYAQYVDYGVCGGGDGFARCTTVFEACLLVKNG